MSRIAFAAQVTAMHCAVMGSADCDQIRRGMGAAFGAGLDVVKIEEDGISTTGGSAAVLVALQHGAPQRRWDVLLRTRAHVGMMFGSSSALVR